MRHAMAAAGPVRRWFRPPGPAILLGVLTLLPAGCGDDAAGSARTVTITVSADGAYWRQAAAEAVAATAGATADLIVVGGSLRQEIDGFGGAFNEQGWDAVAALDEATRQRALRLLFDPRDGARFLFGRLPIGASDYALDRYTLDDVPGDYALEHFSIERDRRLLIPYVRAALAFQPALRLWASAWTPPPWMKTNGAYDSGAMRGDPLALDAYALYLARFVESYGAEGLTIRALHVQNEPAVETGYPSCSWSPELIRDFVRDHLGPLFAARQVGAEIWLGTLSTADLSYPATVLADERARAYVSGVGVQDGALAMVPQLVASYPELPIMQTETNCGNHRSEPGFNPDRPPNDHAYGEFTWGRIADYFRAGARSYMAWNMVLDTEGKNIGADWRWPQNALLVVDRQTRRLGETPAYWAFRHFSGFVAAGARRVELSGTHQQAVAFRNPDGSFVVALQNPDTRPRTLSILVENSLVRVELPARSWATLVD